MTENNVTTKERNPLNEALPQVFNRMGEVKKNPNGQRATNRDFMRIMGKVTYIRKVISEGNGNVRLRIQIPCGSLIVNQDYTAMISAAPINENDDDVLAQLFLSGWYVSTIMGEK